jgi:hypothetical protein
MQISCKKHSSCEIESQKSYKRNLTIYDRLFIHLFLLFFSQQDCQTNTLRGRYEHTTTYIFEGVPDEWIAYA